MGNWTFDMDDDFTLPDGHVGAILGTKYLVFFSSRSLKTREKYISFTQLFLLSLYIF